MRFSVTLRLIFHNRVTILFALKRVYYERHLLVLFLWTILLIVRHKKTDHDQMTVSETAKLKLNINSTKVISSHKRKGSADQLVYVITCVTCTYVGATCT